MKRTILLGAAGVVVLLVAVLAFLFRPGSGTAVDKTEAVNDFRVKDKSVPSGKGAPSTDVPTDTEQPSVPPRGVYTYVTSGQEEVKLGPLPTTTRPFPAEVMASVVVSGDPADDAPAGGCFDFQLSLIAEHVETTRYCRDGDGLKIEGHDKTLSIGPMTATATVICEPGLMILPGVPVDSRDCKLSLAGGPVNVETGFEGTTQIGDVTQVEIQGEKVDALPVTVTYLASGSVTGTWTERFWMSVEDWLPVRIEREVSLVGPMSISEKSRLDLLALDPAI